MAFFSQVGATYRSEVKYFESSRREKSTEMAPWFPGGCLGAARRTKEKYTVRCPLEKRGSTVRAAVCEEVPRRPPTPHHLRAICCLFRDAAPLFMPFLRRYPRLISNPEVQGAADARGRGWARGRAGGRRGPPQGRCRRGGEFSSMQNSGL